MIVAARSTSMGRSNRLPPRAAQAAIIFAMALVLLPGVPLHAKPGGRPGTAGTYRLQARGDYTGEVDGKITPNAFMIPSGNLTDAEGNQIKFKLKQLEIENGRFSGTDTINGQAVEVFGRVDGAEGGVVGTPRLIVTVRFADGSLVRLFGERTGN